MAVLLSERIRDLDMVLTEFERYELNTGLDEKDEVCISITKRGQASLRQSARALKSRAQLTLKFLNNLKS